MPLSEAQLAANRSNALKSTGPRTAEGKERSRANSYKHGLTGEGIVQPEDQAAEVERLARALRDELKPPGEAGSILVRRIATLSVRMDRCAVQEAAALSQSFRKAMDEFEPPEGVDDQTAEKLRQQAGRAALFDDSKRSTLARKYEASAERNLFRALLELRHLRRELEKANPAEQARQYRESLGSFLPVQALKKGIDAVEPRVVSVAPSKPPRALFPADLIGPERPVDVPITIGRRC